MCSFILKTKQLIEQLQKLSWKLYIRSRFTSCKDMASVLFMDPIYTVGNPKQK